MNAPRASSHSGSLSDIAVSLRLECLLAVRVASFPSPMSVSGTRFRAVVTCRACPAASLLGASSSDQQIRDSVADKVYRHLASASKGDDFRRKGGSLESRRIDCSRATKYPIRPIVSGWLSSSRSEGLLQKPWKLNQAKTQRLAR